MRFSDGMQCLEMGAEQFEIEELIALMFLIGQVWTPQAEALGTCMFRTLEREVQRRQWNEDNPDSPQEAEPLTINLTGWSDADVGKALELSGKLEQGAEDARVRELASALHAVCVLAAAERLANSGDERNEIGFLERHGN